MRTEEAERAQRQEVPAASTQSTAGATGVRYCPSCGSSVPAEANFCPSCQQQLGAVPGEHAPISTSHNYNVTGQRLIAGLVDIIILWIIFLLMAASFGTFGETETNRFEVRLSNAEFLLFLLVLYAYYVSFETVSGATVGKLALGLEVVKLNGKPYDIGAALLRNVIRPIDAIFFYLPAIICIAVTEKRQRLGDLAAGTIVVRK